MTSTWSVSPSRLREGLEPLLEVLGVHAVEARFLEPDPPDQIGPVARVEGDARARLVHGDHGAAVAADATPLAEGLAHGLADGDPGVLDRVVQRHVDVALGRALDVDQAMPGQAAPACDRESRFPSQSASGRGRRDRRQRLTGNARLLGNPLDAGRARGLAHAADRKSGEIGALVARTAAGCQSRPATPLRTSRSRHTGA